MVGRTDEYDLFNSETSCKLATLFDTAINSTDESPKAATVADSPKSELRCLILLDKPVLLCKRYCGENVNVFMEITDGFNCSVDSNYKCQERYGLALIGNDDLKIYELILYNNNYNILKKVKLQRTFSFSLLDVSFPDDEKGNNWSVVFADFTSYDEFKKELEKRNVKTVETLEKTDDEQYYEDASVQLNEFIWSWMEHVNRPVKPTCPVIPDNKPSDFSDYVESDSDCSSDNELPLLNQQSESKSREVDTNEPQDFLGEVGLLGKVWTENRTHTYDVCTSLNLISSKINRLLGKHESFDLTRITAMELDAEYLSKKLHATLMKNRDLQRKLLAQRRSKDRANEDVISELQNEKIDRLKKQLLSGDYYQPLKHQEFANEAARCSNLAEVNRLCKKYKYSDDVALVSICRALSAVFRSNDEEATNFVNNLRETMIELRLYFKINFKGDNGFSEDFISKSLPKHTRDTTNYLIATFETFFKISNQKPSVYESDLDLPKLDD